jgi:hypothetical protein
MRPYDVGGSWIFRIVLWFIGFVFMLVISGWILIGFFAYKSVYAINDNGLKGVVEQVWCGKDTECKLPEIK